jgi:hypothetical protein
MHEAALLEEGRRGVEWDASAVQVVVDGSFVEQADWQDRPVNVGTMNSDSEQEDSRRNVKERQGC